MRAHDGMIEFAQSSLATEIHRVPKKTKQICFCQNFVKFPPILIIFGRKMGNDPNICDVHSFSTSPNLRHHLTVLNANVPNCYITPKLLVIDRSHWRPQFNRGRRTFRDQPLECSAGESLSLQNCWHRWTQNASRQRVGAVRPVDHWCHDQPVAPPSERLCMSVHVGHTSSISSDNFEQKCYTVGTYYFPK